VAVDGVAPMAKLKQQRMRRFKSAVTADEEAAIKAATTDRSSGTRGKTTLPERWDTNAITPGTEFMERLTEALYAFQESNKGRVVVSPADEAGEGEQKIMAYMRKNESYGDAVIYGLDADLIILALYHNATRGTTVDLLREETEFGGGVKVDSRGEEQFLYLDTTRLADALFSTYGKPGQPRTAFLADFVGAMSLQGNDFVPHGMGLTIKSEGIERVLEFLRAIPTPLVTQRSDKTATYNVETLRAVVARLAADEETQILAYSRKKLTQRGGQGATDVERALARYQDQPLEWRVEEALVTGGKDKLRLRPGWAERYDEMALGSTKTAAPSVYCEALGWTLAYYAGASVDSEWYYPWPLPPRFASLQSHLASLSVIPVPDAARPALTPKEQLAMVLPASSYHLLPPEYKALCARNPWAFPVAWPVHSLGRRFLWECEPVIPLVSPTQIRRWIEEMEEP
jgi:5'-3' exonuclease